MQHVLFTSLRDASRGPLAAAIFNSLTDAAIVRATSAGFFPWPTTHPVVDEALAELGLEAFRSSSHPRAFSDELLQAATLTIHIGHATGTTLPPNQLVWTLPGLRPGSMPRVHHFRDVLEQKLRPLLAERGWLRLPALPPIVCSSRG